MVFKHAGPILKTIDRRICNIITMNFKENERIYNITIPKCHRGFLTAIRENDVHIENSERSLVKHFIYLVLNSSTHELFVSFYVFSSIVKS